LDLYAPVGMAVGRGGSGPPSLAVLCLSVRRVLRLLTYQLECGKMGCNGGNGYRGLGFDPGEWA